MPVLIVEDDADTRDSLQVLLGSLGIETEAVENGQEAWEFLHRPGPLPCLVLMDLMMPVLSGWELRERMIADGRLRPVPVIVMSATVDGATTLQAAAVVRKPLDFGVLGRMVKEYCGAGLTQDER